MVRQIKIQKIELITPKELTEEILELQKKLIQKGFDIF